MFEDFNVGNMLSGAGDWMSANPNKVNTATLMAGQLGKILNPTGRFAEAGVSLPASNILNAREQERSKQGADWRAMIAKALGLDISDPTTGDKIGLTSSMTKPGKMPGTQERVLSITEPTQAPMPSLEPGPAAPVAGSIGSKKDLNQLLPFF